MAKITGLSLKFTLPFSVPILRSSFESDKFYGVRKADVYIFKVIIPFFRAHIRYLWGNFTFDLINFQRGLENKSVLLQFKGFLKKTAAKLKELKGRRSKEHGVATTINGINVFVDRSVGR